MEPINNNCTTIQLLWATHLVKIPCKWRTWQSLEELIHNNIKSKNSISASTVSIIVTFLIMVIDTIMDISMLTTSITLINTNTTRVQLLRRRKIRKKRRQRRRRRKSQNKKKRNQNLSQSSTSSGTLMSLMDSLQRAMKLLHIIISAIIPITRKQRSIATRQILSLNKEWLKKMLWK